MNNKSFPVIFDLGTHSSKIGFSDIEDPSFIFYTSNGQTLFENGSFKTDINSF